MTHEEFKKLTPGDKLYVPFIEKRVEYRAGTHYIGSDEFEKFAYRRLPVEDVVVYNYDPYGTEEGWKKGLIVQFVKFNLDKLSEKEKENFKLTYREYFPVLCRGVDEKVEKFHDGFYFEVVWNRGIKGGYEERALSLLTKRKREVEKVINTLHRENLKKIDNIIKVYKTIIKPGVKKFLNEQ